MPRTTTQSNKNEKQNRDLTASARNRTAGRNPTYVGGGLDTNWFNYSGHNFPAQHGLSGGLDFASLPGVLLHC